MSAPTEDLAVRPATKEELDQLEFEGKDGTPGLVHAVLGRLGLELVEPLRTKTGNNTTSFVLTCRRRSSGPVTDADVCFFEAGTDPVPPVYADSEIKVVFSTSVVVPDMDHKLLVANRVAAMKLARDSGDMLARLVPKVYGWSDGRSGAIGNGRTWCLMEFLPGVPLIALWEELALDRKAVVMDGVAKIWSALQTVQVPKTDKPFGCFSFADPTSRHSEVIVSESVFHYGGPFATTEQQYLQGVMRYQYEALAHKAPRLNGWHGTDVTLGGGKQCDLGDAVAQLWDKIQADPEFTHSLTEGFGDSPASFTHGDFNEANFLVDQDTLEITALLDFEFAQAAPAIDEFFQCFPKYLLFEGKRNRPVDDEAKAAEFDVRHGQLLRDPPPVSDDAPERTKVTARFVEALKAHGVKGPWTMPPDAADRQASLYWYPYEVCSQEYQRERFWTSTVERVVKHREQSLANTRRTLGNDLARWLS